MSYNNIVSSDTKNNNSSPSAAEMSAVLAKVKIHNIPSLLKEKRRWVLWRYESRDGRKTKVPYNANADKYDANKRASATDPTTWASFGTACQKLADYDCFDGLGFVMANDGLVAIDCDKIRGTLHWDEFLKLPTYAEISPSGTGLRLICLGDLEVSGTKKDWLELYKSERYVTITGNKIDGHSEVRDIQSDLDKIMAAMPKVVKKEKSATSTPPAGLITSPIPLDDQRIIELADLHDESGKFRALWSGADSDLIDAGFAKEDGVTVDGSQCHYGLCHKLAYYTRDADQIKRLLLASGLGSHHKLDREDYVSRTIAKALDAQEQRYTTDADVETVIGCWEPEQFDAVAALPSGRVLPNGKRINWLTPGDIRQRAKDNPITWFVEKWIMRGGLHMLAGTSFAGKSQLLADLVTAIANGLPFGGMTINQTPVLMIDCENHCSITDARIKDKIADDCDFIRWVDDECLSELLPLTVEGLEEIVLDFYAATGHTECVIFADTLRSIFQIDELDPAQINALFYPLQRLARRLNFALVLLNHRPKSGSNYSGHNAMMAALDMFMVYERDADSTTSTLKMIGTRLQQPEEIKFRFVPETCSLVQLLPHEPAKLEDSLAEFINEFPTTVDTAISRKQAAGLFPDLPDKSLRRRLEECQRAGIHPRLERTGDGTKQDPYRYFRV